MEWRENSEIFNYISHFIAGEMYQALNGIREESVKIRKRAVISVCSKRMPSAFVSLQAAIAGPHFHSRYPFHRDIDLNIEHFLSKKTKIRAVKIKNIKFSRTNIHSSSKIVCKMLELFYVEKFYFPHMSGIAWQTARNSRIKCSEKRRIFYEIPLSRYEKYVVVKYLFLNRNETIRILLEYFLIIKAYTRGSESRWIFDILNIEGIV